MIVTEKQVNKQSVSEECNQRGTVKGGRERRGFMPKKERLRVDVKVRFERRQNVFSSVTEHAAAPTHQLRLE